MGGELQLGVVDDGDPERADQEDDGKQSFPERGELDVGRLFIPVVHADLRALANPIGRRSNRPGQATPC